MCITVIKIFVMISFIPPHVNCILLFLFTNKPYEGVRHSLGEDVMVLSRLCHLRRQPDAWVPGWRGPMFLERLAPSAPGVGSDYSLDSRHSAEYFCTQRGARAELIYARACARGLFEWPHPPEGNKKFSINTRVHGTRGSDSDLDHGIERIDPSRAQLPVAVSCRPRSA